MATACSNAETWVVTRSALLGQLASGCTGTVEQERNTACNAVATQVRSKQNQAAVGRYI